MQASTVDEALILVVDPNVSHSGVIRQVLEEQPGHYRLAIVHNGTMALDFLYQRGEFTDAKRPRLILLDLDLPDHHGPDLLAEVKTHPSLRRIPVIVLTASEAPADILRTYVEQGNCYIIKATDSEALSHTIKRIEAFWLEIVTLPQE
jgi:chemotaxis family two-component system response regulator Rcp1